VALFVSCGPKAAESHGVNAQDQERQAEEQEARQQREMHEREAELDERERLLSEREKQLAVAPAPAQQQAEQVQAVSPPPPVAAAEPAAVNGDASYATFYDILSPYGAWIGMAGYGYVWQPAATVKDPRWRPYTLGHWAFADLGWTWISDEPFGWITYHYGRWMRTRSLNWVWTPGDQWAPGWVSWRYGNNFIGWAPLPPEARFDGATGIQQWADQQYNLGASDYTFVPASGFGDDDMAEDAVTEDQNVAIYDDSNNMTNIYYDSVTYAIICHGPNYDFMRSKSRRALAPLLRISRGGFSTAGKNGAVIAGNTLEVAAPRIVPSRGVVAPRMIRERVADTRLVSATSVPAPQGAVNGAQPTNRAPAGGGVPAAGGAPEAARAVGAPAAGMGIPSRPTTELPEGAVQRAQDLQNVRQQDQAEQARRQEEATRAAEERYAKEAAHAAERAAADEQAAKATREQTARGQAVRQAAQDQAVREKAVREAQGAGSPGTGQGRGQQ